MKQTPSKTTRPPKPGSRMSKLLLLAALTGCASAPSSPPRLARGDHATLQTHMAKFIASGMKTNKVTGLSIALVSDQRVLWSEGFGWADTDAQLKATDQTLYRMGSISKLFTSTAAMQLAQQGQLNIDAPIQQALPGFKTGEQAITPRLLMTHHAGLTRDKGEGMWGSDVGQFQAMVRALNSDHQDFPPGLLFSYSNVGMTVLGAAIENAARKPFEAHIKTTLLEPLGMDTAFFSSAPGPGLSRAYKDGKPAKELALRDTPAGGLNASVLDMSRFMMMVFAQGRSATGASILLPEDMAEMLNTQNAHNALDFDLHTGLGWMLNSLGPDALRNGGLVAHHNGGTINFHSQMYVLPEHKLGVIVAANSAGSAQFVDAVAKRALAMALEAKTGIQQPAPKPEFTVAQAPISEAQFQSWLGDYATIAGHARVERDGKRLKVQAMGQALDLVPGKNGDMGLSYKLLGLFSLPIPDFKRFTLSRKRVGTRELLVARSGGQEILVGERLSPQPDPRAAAWVGTYKPVVQNNEEPIERIELRMDKQVLLATVHMTAIEGGATEVLPIRLVSEREARVLRSLADFGETVRLHEINGQPGFEVSGIAFVKSAP
jgi:CubicO group peptidase (beta-lactamase class C family)